MKMKKYLIALMLMVLSWTVPVYAQDTFIIEAFGTYQFFVVVIAGVILAAALQLFLTNLAVAVGLSATKIVVEKDTRDKAGEKNRPSDESTSDRVYSTIRKINGAYGIMTVVTGSLAVFGASWMALQIAGPPTLLASIILALIIWGVSYILSLTLEIVGVSTMLGSLAGVARQSMRTLTHGTTKVLERSEGRRQADKARAITAAVRSELFGHMDVQKQIKHYIQELKPEYGPRDYRKELETLLDELEIESFISEDTAPGGMPEIIQKVRTAGAKMNREQAKTATHQIRGAFSRVREEVQSDKKLADKAIDSAMRISGMTREEAEANRKKMEDFLRSTHKNQLDPEGIKRDLEALYRDPRLGAESLQRRLSAIDRDTIETILAQRQDMTREEVHAKIDQVWGTIENLIGRMEQRSEQARERTRQTEGAGVSAKEKALNRLEAYIDSLDRPNLDPEAIRHDFELLLHDPKTGIEDLYHRMKNLNREDVMAIVTSTRYISREDADRMVDRIMEMRDMMLERADQMKREIQHRVDQIEQEARHQADQVRKTLASAAWWNFNAALGSGAAACIAGWLSVIT
jgi:hypothetical protein